MNAHLKRISGNFFLEIDGEMIGIEAWEAERILADRDYIYEVIIDRKRKYAFNTAEDSPGILNIK